MRVGIMYLFICLFIFIVWVLIVKVTNSPISIMCLDLLVINTLRNCNKWGIEEYFMFYNT